MLTLNALVPQRKSEFLSRPKINLVGLECASLLPGNYSRFCMTKAIYVHDCFVAC
jgi:hypothetical protein